MLRTLCIFFSGTICEASGPPCSSREGYGRVMHKFNFQTKAGATLRAPHPHSQNAPCNLVSTSVWLAPGRSRQAAALGLKIKFVHHPSVLPCYRSLKKLERVWEVPVERRPCGALYLRFSLGRFSSVLQGREIEGKTVQLVSLKR